MSYLSNLWAGVFDASSVVSIFSLPLHHKPRKRHDVFAAKIKSRWNWYTYYILLWLYLRWNWYIYYILLWLYLKIKQTRGSHCVTSLQIVFYIPVYCFIIHGQEALPNILNCLFSLSSNALRAGFCVNTGHKPFYEEYQELRVWIYEWVRRITFYSCALRCADDENKQRGMIHVKLIIKLQRKGTDRINDVIYEGIYYVFKIPCWHFTWRYSLQDLWNIKYQQISISFYKEEIH